MVDKQHKDNAGVEDTIRLHDLLVSLLQIELFSRPLRDSLQEALDIILKAPFSQLLPSGAIFLSNHETQELDLLVHHNFAEPLKKLCAKVPFGRCLCGRAAEEGVIIHAAGLDHRHETRFDGIQPHGHYNVPIISGARVLGVMVLYLPVDHVKDAREVRFLETAALVLAGIIERNRYQEQQENHYQTLIENLPQGIFYKDINLRYVSCNRVYARDLGIQEGDIHGRSDQDFYPQQQAEAFAQEDRWVLESGETIEKDVVRSFRGVPSSYHMLKAPMRTQSGRIIGVLGIYWDNSEEKRSQAALKESEEKFSAMANSAQDAIVMLNQDEEVIFWNMASESMFGFQVQDIVGLHLDEWIEPGESRERMSRLLCELIQTEDGAATGQTLELTARRKSGESFPIELSISGLKLKGQWHAIGIIRDISERKRAEQQRQIMEVQLRQAQKLESIGQLAAGISHEINTPSQFVGDNIRFLQEAMEDLRSLLESYRSLVEASEGHHELQSLVTQIKDREQELDLAFLLEEIPQSIDQSMEGIARISKIVRAMKEFSHPGEVDKVEMDLNHAIRTTLEVSRNEWKYVAQVELDLDPHLPHIQAVPDQMNQVFLNLVVNAAHAIAEHQEAGAASPGYIKITTRCLDVDDAVQIRISDSGTGVPDEIKERIFDPFFTTKKVGMGTGQGLCIAFTTVVEKHGGRLEVEDGESGGAVFVITLPLRPEDDTKGREAR